MSLHLSLRDKLAEHYAGRLAGAVELRQDAVLFSLDNGVAVELRWLDAGEYSIAWRWGEALLRVDTAPLHRHLKTFPNHLHGADGVPREDPVTVLGRDPWLNVNALIDRLLTDPLLE